MLNFSQPEEGPTDVSSPAFQLYVNDFLGSAKVGMMDADEVGAYVLLLCLDWQEGGFVFDEKRLAKWCRLTPKKFRKAWEILQNCFAERDGKFWNPRLEKERLKQAEWARKSADGAALTNEKRWGKRQGGDRGGDQGGDEMATPGVSPNGRTPFPLPFLTQETSSSPSVQRLLDGLPNDVVRATWLAVINAARQGMQGSALTDEQVDRACEDYVGNGHLANPSLRHFRAFLTNAGKPVVVRPFSATHRPSKQEVGRANLAAWLASDDEVSNGK